MTAGFVNKGQTRISNAAGETLRSVIKKTLHDEKASVRATTSYPARRHQMGYVAPLKDMLFVIDELADVAGVATLPGFEDATIETVQAVLDEAAKFNGEVLAPLNFEGDKHPSTWSNGEVTTTPGFKEAFR